MKDKIKEGQTFTARDGGIKVTVSSVGNSKQKARFKVENLTTEKRSYTITVKKRSGVDADRIDHKTDDQGTGEYELSADETIGIEITQNAA